MLLKLEGFQYATSIDLNMRYYHIQLIKNVSNLCTIIIPWGGYCYKCLLMGIANSPDIFQHKMNDLFHGFKFIRAYIYRHLIFLKGEWIDHAEKLGLALNKMKVKGLK